MSGKSIPCPQCGTLRPQGGTTKNPKSVCRTCWRARMPQRPKTVLCTRCQEPRKWHSRIKPEYVCRKCAYIKRAQRHWKYAQDSHGARAERAKKWVEPVERPTIVGLRIGTLTKFGKVEGRGINSQHGRYYVFLKDGVSTQVPAEKVEAD